MKYKSVIVTRRGGPEVLQVVENDLRPPAAGEARIKVPAAAVCPPRRYSQYRSRRLSELQPGMIWPVGSWAFTKPLGEEATRLLASIAMVLAAIGFVLA